MSFDGTPLCRAPGKTSRAKGFLRAGVQEGWALLSLAASCLCPLSSPQSIFSFVLHSRVSASCDDPGSHSDMGLPALFLGQGEGNTFPQAGVLEGFGMFQWCLSKLVPGKKKSPGELPSGNTALGTSL